MAEKRLNKLMQWWVGKNLSTHYTLDAANYKFLKTWVIHPIKRRLAKSYIYLLKLAGLKVISVTGSVGKTTTKEMITSVLSQKYKTVSSFKNIDPVFNIPTTILKTQPGTQKLILEMGVEYLGDMDFYNWLVKSDVGVLMNIYWTHTEFLQGIDNVQEEKGKLIKNLPNDGYAILNADDSRVTTFVKKTRANVLTFGVNKRADVMAKNIGIDENFKTKFKLLINGESAEITIPILGRHFIYSALAAAAVGYALGVPFHLIEKGLKSFKLSSHRMIPIMLSSSAVILDDTYNSNPLGAKAAIDVLSEIGKNKKKIAVLGDMLELGDYTQKGHREIGEYAAKSSIDSLICIGEYADYLAEGASKGGMSKKDVLIFNDRQSAEPKIKELISRDSIVLLKASRKLRFEELVGYLQK